MNSIEKLSHKIAAFFRHSNIYGRNMEADIEYDITTMNDKVVTTLKDIANDRDNYSAMQRAEAKAYADEIEETYYELVTMKPRLFVDMDGTLAVFKKVDTLETLYEKNYFSSLEPQMNVVDAVRNIIENNTEIEVFILSAVLTDSKYALNEKNDWLDRYLPEIDMQHRIFPPCGEDKKDYIPMGVRPDDCLLDDYTKNLVLWCPPGQAIKLLNGINHTRGTWKGYKLSANEKSEVLAENIENLMINHQLEEVQQIAEVLEEDFEL